MSKEQVILQVLREAGIYQQAREKVSSDAELARLFDEDFENLMRVCAEGV
ncbi:MAG: hypothetical protein H8D55_02520 [Deltaproteobacteria bacterium]|nr:hypothetical protein [Deltaproteobacteria bacterium]MBL7217184.1 hypothetical protein [Desulfobacteraceae bacterium]